MMYGKRIIEYQDSKYVYDFIEKSGCIRMKED